MTETPHISFTDFQKIDIRSGKIIKAETFPEARNPSYKLFIDFGDDIGTKKTSAQITKNYTPEELVGTMVSAVINFPPKQIGPFMSEVLVLGFPDHEGEIVLVRPDNSDIPLGVRLF